MSEIETILVPVDVSSHSRAAAQRALSIGRETGGRVRLLHALSFPATAIEVGVRHELFEEFRKSEQARFQSFCEELDVRGVDVSSSFVERDPAEAINAAAREAGTQLIVMGSHSRRGLERMVLGSVAEQILESSRAALLVVREEPDRASRPIRSILLVTDFSEAAQQAEALVVEWAQMFGAEVEVFHSIQEAAVLLAPYAVVGSGFFEEEMLAAAKKRMQRVLERLQARGIRAKSKIVCGRADEEILKRAESTNADLIAMGTRGYSGLQRFVLGSVAQRVLRHAQCSVLVVGSGGRELQLEGEEGGAAAHPQSTKENQQEKREVLVMSDRDSSVQAAHHPEELSGAEELATRLFSLVAVGVLALIVFMAIMANY